MKTIFLFLLIGYQTLHTGIANTLVDPTKPVSTKSIMTTNDLAAKTDNTLMLTAIMNSAYAKQAIINGRSYVEGQKILGYQIDSIDHNQVVLSSPNGNKTLFVNNSNIKKDLNNDLYETNIGRFALCD